MTMLKEVFSNKVAIFNIILVSAILIFLLISNVQQEINIEEYATIPMDYTPMLDLRPIQTTKIEVELQYDKDTSKEGEEQEFLIEYMIGIYKDLSIRQKQDCKDTQTKPLPLSPATSIYFVNTNASSSSNNNNNTNTIALAIKKITEEPALYLVNIALFKEDIYNIITCYFSDPFPTGYNSMILYIPVEDKIDKVRVEVKKVKTLD